MKEVEMYKMMVNNQIAAEQQEIALRIQQVRDTAAKNNIDDMITAIPVYIKALEKAKAKMDELNRQMEMIEYFQTVGIEKEA